MSTGMKIIQNSLIPIGKFLAINILGIVFTKNRGAISRITLNHEAIHTAQMRELLYIPFYLLYIFEWVYRLIFCRGNAYRNISFEREAYANQSDLGYLKHRKMFSMWRK